MNRQDLKRLARHRLREADQLLRLGMPSGAYYLAGIAVECGLKACIARKTRRFDFPDKTVAVESWTHDLSKLVKVAGLNADLDRRSAQDLSFARNWTVVKDWNVESRYEFSDLRRARDLLQAIKMRRSGVMAWVRSNW